MSWYMQHINAEQNAWATAPQTTFATKNGNGVASLFAPKPAGITPSGSTSG